MVAGQGGEEHGGLGAGGVECLEGWDVCDVGDEKKKEERGRRKYLLLMMGDERPTCRQCSRTHAVNGLDHGFVVLEAAQTTGLTLLQAGAEEVEPLWMVVWWWK